MILTLRQKIFSHITPLARYYRVVKVLAVLQCLVTIGSILIWPTIDTALWLLLLALFGFLLSSYALLRLAHHHEPNRKGLLAWFIHLWENLIFISWLLVALAIVILVFKLVLFMWQG